MIGFAGFISSFLLCCFLGVIVPSAVELPMGEMGNIAVDRAGNIYCASSGYGRIQIYDKYGKFIRGIFVGGGGGKITMDIDDKERLQAYVSKARTLYICNPDGTIEKQKKDVSAGSVNTEVTDNEGNIYSIVTPSIYPRVRKTTPDRKESIIVAVPLHLLIFQGPLPTWIILFIGIVLTIVVEILKIFQSPLNKGTSAW